MGTINYNGRNNTYTYMAWQMVTAPDSQQYQLKEDAGQNFDNEGFGKINGRYVIACTTHYGEVGDYIDWVLYNGDTLHTIIGEIKSSGDSNWDEYGHIFGNDLNVIEFIVDYNSWYNGHDNPGTSSCHPEWAGLLQSYENLGNYWENTIIPEATGNGQLLIVTGTRYSYGKNWNVWYLATYQKDGYLYFNDDVFWRCHMDGSDLQLHYLNKDVWIRTTGIQNININKFSSAYGNGSIAANANVENAVLWAIKKCRDEYTTYGRIQNWKDPSANIFDCSSFVITAFYVGGFDVNASSTHDMKQGFIDEGFEWIPMTSIPANACQRGDILLREYGGPGDGHTQIYIGNNQDANCGGNPASIVTHEEDGYGYGWDGILRYP